MFEHDYLVRMFTQFFQALVRSLERSQKEKDPLGAAGLIEEAIGVATEIDGETLLSLAPESMASILSVSGTDPRVIEYVSRGLILEASYLDEGNMPEMAELRREQARALASAYDFELDEEPLSAEKLAAILEENEPPSSVILT